MMSQENIHLKPIGFIKTPFVEREGMPIQPTGATGVKGEIEILDEFMEGLKDLEGFSHIILIYYFHKSEGFQLNVKPFIDDHLRGVFSTRAPKRPNPIGFSVVKLNRIEANRLFIENVDMLNGTPVLDIKPYIPDIDSPVADKIGWLEGISSNMRSKKSDSRFK